MNIWCDLVSIATDLISAAITVNRGGIGVDYYDRQKGTEPDRQTCRQPRAHAPDDAEHEPGETWRRARSDIPAGAEIREGHQPDRCQPVAADCKHSPGPGFLLLRRRAACAVGAASGGHGR